MKEVTYIKEKMRKMKSLLCFPNMLLLTGCSQVNTDSELYQKIDSQTKMLSEGIESAETHGTAWLVQKVFSISNTLKGVAPFIIAGSILFGLLLLHMVDKDQAIRKKAILLFFIIIPIGMIILTYGMAYMCGVFS